MIRHLAVQMLNVESTTEQELASVMKDMKEILSTRAKDADENVKQTTTALINLLAYETSALILAWEHAVHMLYVKFRSMCRNVHVRLGILVIPFSHAVKNQEHLHQERILAYLLHADPIHNAEKSMIKQFVHACQAILEALQVVDQNALSILNAPLKWLV